LIKRRKTTGATKRAGLPLSGVRVLDFTIAMAGPLATQRLGDLGADVVKIESFAGDLTRVFRLCGVAVGGETTSYLALNRNKRSIAVNLKMPEGLAVVRKLARTADVVLQNFRPGVAERLKINYRALRRINPKLVFVSISGYGASGPLVGAPGQDLLVQSFTGVTFSAGAVNDPPHAAPTYVVDACASHVATEAVLAGLLHRQRTRKGQHIQTSLLAAALEMQCQEVMTYFQTRRVAPRSRAPFASAWLEPPYGIYPAADAWIALSQNDNRLIAEIVGSPELARLADAQPDVAAAPEDDVLTWRDAMYQALQTALAVRPAAEWLQLLSARGVWCGPVNTFHESLEHDQTRPLLATLNVDGTPVKGVGHVFSFSDAADLPLNPPPHHGEHTAEILKEAGYSASRVKQLTRSGAIR
jgi:crotonobetainyl-CoA:carnitine CoA-transferase CaiB-like acyl-CoA transferase